MLVFAILRHMYVTLSIVKKKNPNAVINPYNTTATSTYTIRD